MVFPLFYFQKRWRGNGAGGSAEGQKRLPQGHLGFKVASRSPKELSAGVIWRHHWLMMSILREDVSDGRHEKVVIQFPV